MVSARKNGTHSLKNGVHKFLVQRSVLEEQADIEWPVQQIEDGVGIEVRADFSIRYGLAQ